MGEIPPQVKKIAQAATQAISVKFSPYKKKEST
jgi:hypothetical protein